MNSVIASPLPVQGGPARPSVARIVLILRFWPPDPAPGGHAMFSTALPLTVMSHQEFNAALA
jgi:hypothetical protein